MDRRTHLEHLQIPNYLVIVKNITITTHSTTDQGDNYYYSNIAWLLKKNPHYMIINF